jgi:hypothetical protein
MFKKAELIPSFGDAVVPQHSLHKRPDGHKCQPGSCEDRYLHFPLEIKPPFSLWVLRSIC